MKIEDKAIATLKMNGIASIDQANSGHPGIVLGAAKIIHTIFTKHLIISKKNPTWINRDRFILSAGHGSALLYSMLEKIDYLSIKDLKEFRQWKSLTPGHPEYGHTPGVDMTTGPLGQGIASAVGLAIGEAHLNSKFKEINHYTYVLCGDGDLQEGISYESMSLAGKQELNKLIVLHDSNSIQLDTKVEVAFNENLEKRVQSMGWNYILVENNEVESINQAIIEAKKSLKKPTFIEVKTIIGEGANKQGTSAVHGAPLSKVDLDAVAKELGIELDDMFSSPKDVKEYYKETILDRGEKAYLEFKVSKELSCFMSKEPVKIDINLSKDVATRVTSGEIIQELNKKLPNWIGGSADLTSSTKAIGGDGDFMPNNRQGRNIMFGVREFAMAAIANGLALHSNFKPFISTFFVFVDYLKPALRLAALMKLPVTYIMTHDSIFVGEDGPTHEPIEQYAMVRSIPNVNVIRPADEKEVQAAYEIAINSTQTPTLIGLTRQDIVSQKETQVNDSKKGAYIIYKGENDKTIIATGSDLSLAINVGKKTNTTVVSMPSTNLFEQQSKEYKELILGNYNKTVTVESATTFGWRRYGKYNLGIDRFGESAPGNKIYKEFGFTEENLIEIINKIK
ncbi:MAG: transketolase [Mycoplasma sp.]|nr:transketolase [Mycoplasma sp.]